MSQTARPSKNTTTSVIFGVIKLLEIHVVIVIEIHDRRFVETLRK